ncbi:MAG: hypothetical protein WB799_12870 [Candidatus Sulfotelmatobacter sp.]
MVAEIKRLSAKGMPLQFPPSTAIALPATGEGEAGEAAAALSIPGTGTDGTDTK